jgi:hypothetical protein
MGICAREPNGIVTNYRTARLASWAKIKNPDYSQPILQVQAIPAPKAFEALAPADGALCPL